MDDLNDLLRKAGREIGYLGRKGLIQADERRFHVRKVLEIYRDAGGGRGELDAIADEVFDTPH
jgi:hypothetical protein